MPDTYTVYILKSDVDGSYYTGMTTDLRKRLVEHNTAKNPSTRRKVPYSIAWHCVFQDKNKALDFEKYLKSGSGFAFARKRLV